MAVRERLYSDAWGLRPFTCSRFLHSARQSYRVLSVEATSRYSQLYSRTGFARRFGPLDRDDIPLRSSPARSTVSTCRSTAPHINNLTDITVDLVSAARQTLVVGWQ